MIGELFGLVGGIGNAFAASQNAKTTEKEAEYQIATQKLQAETAQKIAEINAKEKQAQNSWLKSIAIIFAIIVALFLAIFLVWRYG